ncbi:MAG: hypothetical protein JWN72_1034 [Thermoleophilia bacterium]|nr:hypothetical protein [Thermoleophilia bacterium]
MAPSPAVTTTRRRPAAPLRVGSHPSVILADVISYGYAAVIVLATMQFNLQFSLLEGIGVMALFVVLRAVAHEIRKDARKQLLAEARRRAALHAQSPSRWTVEQRDGVGRRIDIGA